MSAMHFFQHLWGISADRCTHWHGSKGVHDWSVLEWAGAFAGEAGEAANVAKKLKRVLQGIDQKGKDDPAKRLQELDAALVEECVDVFLYMPLLLASRGISSFDFMLEVKRKFDAVSDQIGYDRRLEL